MDKVDERRRRNMFYLMYAVFTAAFTIALLALLDLL
jgi:hypothetical protein